MENIHYADEMNREICLSRILVNKFFFAKPKKERKRNGNGANANNMHKMFQ